MSGAGNTDTGTDTILTGGADNTPDKPQVEEWPDQFAITRVRFDKPRREGHSRLVYDKAARTINVVDPHPDKPQVESPRNCTCHPDEAPNPCQHKYAYSECVTAARVESLKERQLSSLHRLNNHCLTRGKNVDPPCECWYCEAYDLIGDQAAALTHLENENKRQADKLDRASGIVNDFVNAISRGNARNATLQQKLERAVEAISIFVPPGNETLEGVLWGNQPDDAQVTITLKHGEYRRARDLLSSVKG